MDPSNPSGLVLTPQAFSKIQHMMARDPQVFLRISVQSGGCSGFQYHFQTDHVLATDDHIFHQEGITYVIDHVSWPFLRGSTLDYVESMTASHFALTNPQAKIGCGCGNSFAV